LTKAAPSRTPAKIERLDRQDPLASYRDAFRLDPELIYLDGNSLGALPKAAAGQVERVISKEWGEGLIRSWNTHDWIVAPQRIGAKIAGLIGARPGEVIAADSTSVNLFKLVGAATMLDPARRTILSEPGNFPTDLYVMEGLEALLGRKVRLRLAPAKTLISAINQDTAAVVLTHVHYAAGRRWPMAQITETVHAKGALMIWDLSHSAGALAVDLNGAGADLAVGCGYKYLNGGPGAPAFLFVAERHQSMIRSPLSGWMGHAAPFAFEDAYRPASGIDRFLCGTPSILGLAALETGLDLLGEADMTAVETKGLALAELFIAQTRSRCPGLPLASPVEAKDRGLHLCYRHAEAYAVMQALIERGVIGDFRAPDLLRFGFSPLYVSYRDVWRAVEILAEVLESRAFDYPRHRRRAAVT
jgi:kynureninase